VSQPTIEPETLHLTHSDSLDIPTVEELEEEVTSVRDEEEPDELDIQQDPDDIDAGESNAAYLENIGQFDGLAKSDANGSC
jgi:hypothetical protein